MFFVSLPPMQQFVITLLWKKEFTRLEFRLGIGSELQTIPWGTKTVKLPPSQLKK